MGSRLYSGQSGSFGAPLRYKIEGAQERAALWDRLAFQPLPAVDSQNIPGSMLASRKLGTDVGVGRVGRTDQILNPALGTPWACGRPPTVPRTSLPPADMTRSDWPIPHYKADQRYADILYKQRFFGVPAITQQQTLSGQSYSIACG